MNPFFSIIIPVKSINAYVRETVPHIINLNNKNWELLILPNEIEPSEWLDSRITVLPSGKVGPAKKRDLGASKAQGEVLVFLDDDSYPEPNFLDVSRSYFDNQQIVAVGGPAVTPKDDSFWQKVSGAVFLSRLSGGAPERYIPVGKPREVVDWPSVNLMVRRKEFLAVGGFDSPFWPGEDTKLCLDLIKKTNKKIIYVPEMVVWHHRREGFFAHLKQIGGYGLHRGYFAKRYPETSLKLGYFIPSAFFFFVVLSLSSLILPNLLIPSILKIAICIGWVLYLLAMFISLIEIRKFENLKIGLVALFYIFFTHIYYGIRFIQGLLTSNLVSRLR